MRIANLAGRLVVLTGDAGHEIARDVEKNSSGRFGPAALLAPGDELVSRIEGIGELRHRFAAAR
jgi:hypothetical protein